MIHFSPTTGAPAQQKQQPSHPIPIPPPYVSRSRPHPKNRSVLSFTVHVCTTISERLGYLPKAKYIINIETVVPTL
ncbi:hypothetical protein P167DRAFT_532378 [Morchella conica CCBAS932]|uniref:Uncharacterized protein n=1 Tax=Morchella conica CCBAS932 TaxID=1392247 RepID=A0A3N4L0L7_9PEZI|nr:hypothetical protein P167DRAFT_532378 [Morchella conica CCBAS932]